MRWQKYLHGLSVLEMNEMNVFEIPRRLLIAIVRMYQYLISPLLPPTCRFVPSCSSYTIQAFEKYGVVRGGIKGLLRILRCHPFSRGGYDPLR